MGGSLAISDCSTHEQRDGTCRLKFDGEEEEGKETEVERRLVLDVGDKR